MKSTLILFSFILCSILAIAQASADKIVGVWLSQKKDGKIEIIKSGKSYQGKIVWIKNPIDKKTNKPPVDAFNPDASKRNQPILGLTIFKDLLYKDENSWEEGKIYEPDSGKTYSFKISLKDINTLNLTGYVGFSFIGRTEVWTRTTK